MGHNGDYHNNYMKFLKHYLIKKRALKLKYIHTDCAIARLVHFHVTYESHISSIALNNVTKGSLLGSGNIQLSDANPNTNVIITQRCLQF